ncbi:hypothetical protein [Nocardia sp. NPDC060249]|uniref:hypothetical protein n=1 Tax=Nocardia sp. NPDC060249 TaxID=3347082 RepID=UPI00364E03CB
MRLGERLQKPERDTAGGSDEEQTVVILLKSQTEGGQAQRDTPALDGEKSLIESAHDVEQSRVLGIQVIVQAIQVAGLHRSIHVVDVLRGMKSGAHWETRPQVVPCKQVALKVYPIPLQGKGSARMLAVCC